MVYKLTDEPVEFTIGVYILRISCETPAGRIYCLPEHTGLFLKDGKSRGINLNYSIQLRPLFSEPQDTPIAGFEKGPCPYGIYREASGDYLWVRKNKYGEISLAFLISPDWSSWRLIADNSGSHGMDSFNELAYIFAYSVLNKGGILFHGVVMEWKGMGIIVCAHSGVGKTTHTGMWKEYENARILNGDRALCGREADCWYSYGAPWNGSSGECMNRRVKLDVVVILEQAKDNRVSVLDSLQGAYELIPLAFAPSWEEELLNCSLDSIDNIVGNTPILKLSCRPDLAAVSVLKKELEKIRNKKYTGKKRKAAIK